jgi:hypothetical protein
MRFAVGSARFETDAQECLDHYQLERWGGVVRRGMWRERHTDGLGNVREHDTVPGSWVELELEWDELPRFEAHVRQFHPPGRPHWRGLVLCRGRTGDAVTHRGILRWFVGAEIPPLFITSYDTGMD